MLLLILVFFVVVILIVIEDGELLTTVESVLDGTEEILSFFFTSRKAKTRERGGCTQSDGPFSDATRPGEISSPLKNRNCETTQWTPLSLSEISGSCSVESSLTNQHREHDYASQCHQQTSVVCVTDGQKSQSELQLDAPQVFVSPLDAISAPSLSRKPKKFMYPVGDSASSRQDVRQRFYKPLHQSPTMPCPGKKNSVGKERPFILLFVFLVYFCNIKLLFFQTFLKVDNPLKVQNSKQEGSVKKFTEAEVRLFLLPLLKKMLT